VQGRLRDAVYHSWALVQALGVWRPHATPAVVGVLLLEGCYF
jgi:hypothetical protein